MAIFADVKCSNCDRKYSAFRLRCPYCGARRRKKGKRVSDSDNSLWKVIIGGLLIAVLVVAVIILLVSTLNKDKAPEDETDPSYSAGEGVTDVVNDPSDTQTPDVQEPVDTPPEDEPVDTPPEPPAIAVESVKITAYGRETTDFTMKVGEKLQLKAVTVPEDTEIAPVWSSSNEDVFVVLQDGTVTAIGKSSGGSETLTVTCGEATATCIVRVK